MWVRLEVVGPVEKKRKWCTNVNVKQLKMVKYIPVAVGRQFTFNLRYSLTFVVI